MNTVISFVTGFLASLRWKIEDRDERGASLVEYALLLALIAVVAILALKFLGGAVSSTLSNVGNSISNP